MTIAVLVLLALWCGYFAALRGWLTAVPPASDVPVHQAWTGIFGLCSIGCLVAAIAVG